MVSIDIDRAMRKIDTHGDRGAALRGGASINYGLRLTQSQYGTQANER